MRIGIITIHKSEVNYGACLQSFALWRYLSNLGHNCEIIDLLRPCHAEYRPSPAFNEQKPSFPQKAKSLLKHLLASKKQNDNLGGKKNLFEEFNKLSNYTKTYRSVDELYRASLDDEVYITGSDQVWNPRINTVKAPYFLDFAPQGKKKISYASSFGIDALPDEVKPQYREWLSSYQSLSTREESGACIVEELIGKKPKVVVDPVFLLTADQWRKYEKSLEGIGPKNYFFLYMLHFNEQYLNYAVKLAKEANKPLYFVLSEDRIVEDDYAQQLTDIGPGEWLWLIENAYQMITTSFHGSAFCTIFNSPYTVIMQDGVTTNTRISGLLKMFHVEYNEKKTPEGMLIIDTKSSDKDVIMNTIRLSQDYLAQSIGE